ncbi:hypothetical protein FOA52_000457 [Chlamydomonas sp. UWO 241]|nr:hypothetical protein FOA52_000457 [Chlamydomonas sp. UWO 241]
MTATTAIKNTLAVHQAKKASRRADVGSKSSTHQSINTRVWKMAEEAVEFTSAIQAFETEVANTENATLEFFDQVVPMLSVPLPRVWDEIEGGLAEPKRVIDTHTHPSIAGGKYGGDEMQAAVTRFELRSRTDIFKPTARWLDALKNVRTELMPELEKRRAELERRVAKLNAAEQQLAATKGKSCFGGGAHVDAVEQRAQEGAAAANAADDDGVAVPTEQQNAEEDAAVQMADKDRKLEAARAMFDEKEAQVFEQLRALCNDATWLKSYMGSQLMRFKELMQSFMGSQLMRFKELMQPADGGVVSASLLNAKPAVGGIGVEPRGGGVLRVLFTVASDAVADTVVRWRHELRRCVDSTAVFDVLSDREEAQHQALWPAFLAAKVAGKRAQFHRARLVVDGERVPAPAC